ncbi:MAG TPA: ABC transporter ATP-binding protein [Pyrinomonadaceae bacterium]|nr:ABC transporter ATP-binding protein [Pyrinomonadaceae bacterium]
MRIADQTIETFSPVSSVGEGLNVVDLRKTYLTTTGARLEVLTGLTLKAEPGEAVAIRGASGSGKSTLLHLLGGLDEADHGMIDLGGTELFKLSSRSLESFRQNKVGFIFQFHYLLQDLSAIENVVLPLMISRRKRVEAVKLARELLQKFGLGDRLESRVGQLSGGEQQRVAVARALITKPKLLLADEPTGNLDSSIGAEIGDLLVEYAHRSSSIVIVATHNEDLVRVCDRGLILKDGRLHPL